MSSWRATGSAQSAAPAHRDCRRDRTAARRMPTTRWTRPACTSSPDSWTCTSTRAARRRTRMRSTPTSCGSPTASRPSAACRWAPTTGWSASAIGAAGTRSSRPGSSTSSGREPDGIADNRIRQRPPARGCSGPRATASTV